MTNEDALDVRKRDAAVDRDIETMRVSRNSGYQADDDTSSKDFRMEGMVVTGTVFSMLVLAVAWGLRFHLF